MLAALAMFILMPDVWAEQTGAHIPWTPQSSEWVDEYKRAAASDPFYENRADVAGIGQQGQPGSADVQRAFNILQAMGQASNTGQGGSEALRQACVLGQQQSALSLNGLLDSRLGPEGAGDTSLHSLIFQQGLSGLNQALGGACAALLGTGGDAGFLQPARLFEMGAGLALGEGEAAIKSWSEPFVERFELETGFEDGSFMWEALAVVPVWKDNEERNFVFSQISWHSRTEEDDTMNAGLAYRRLSPGRSAVYGINAFIDHAMDRGHNRMSVGADIQTAEVGLSTNRYIPLSGWKSVDEYKEERASSGWDAELQGRLPQFPSWQLNLRGYEWSSDLEKTQNDTFGYESGLHWTPVKALSFEAGVRNEQDSLPDYRGLLRIAHRFGEPIDTMWERPVALTDMRQRVYDKVRRENSIRVEQRAKESAYVTVLETAGVNTAVTASDTISLRTGLHLPRPFTVSVSAATGSIARLVFRDGAILTIGAGSQVRVEAKVVTLISGLFQYVSGSQNVAIAVPGGTVTLLGTDVDVSTNGATSVLRVRDGQARLTGAESGQATLSPGEGAAAVAGVVGVSLAVASSVYIQHADDISLKIDRTATGHAGEKIAPYAVNPPRLTGVSTVPGQPITIGLKFNQAMTVTGSPRLLLELGGATRYATYAGGSGTDDLSFTYTLQVADVGLSEIMVQGLELNGGTMTGSGKNVVLTLADTVLTLEGGVTDVTAPAGYAVAFTTDPIGASNQNAAGFQVTGAEVGAAYAYTITSSGGREALPIPGLLQPQRKA